ncbi:hypothetical protein ACFQQB_61165 [Nonomuraea rubra]|uniref:hypothetical protein n=1 Tax=Nonomuraea rubra TaxID=46180 RepID=UPI00360AB285
MGNESVLCPVCRRVLPATGKESYTPLRGRLIVTNGYCAGGCAEAAGQAQQQQAQQQTQQMVRPQAAPPLFRCRMPGRARRRCRSVRRCGWCADSRRPLS